MLNKARYTASRKLKIVFNTWPSIAKIKNNAKAGDGVFS